MAKKKSLTDAAAAPQPLTEADRRRAERVLVSQGRAIGLLDCFPVEMQQQFAEYCDPASGAIKAGTREAVERLIANFYADQKATVEQEGTGFGLPDAGK